MTNVEFKNQILPLVFCTTPPSENIWSDTPADSYWLEADDEARASKRENSLHWAKVSKLIAKGLVIDAPVGRGRLALLRTLTTLPYSRKLRDGTRTFSTKVVLARAQEFADEEHAYLDGRREEQS